MSIETLGNIVTRGFRQLPSHLLEAVRK
jgi:hypothetical protein